MLLDAGCDTRAKNKDGRTARDLAEASGHADLAATLATEGSFRNSGQRCTAVKRIVVEEF